MGMKAVELLVEGKSGLAIGIINGQTTHTPILEALKLPRINRREESIKFNKLNQN